MIQSCHYCFQLAKIQIIDSFDEPPEVLCDQCLEDMYPDVFRKKQSARKFELRNKIVKEHHYDATKLIIEFKDGAFAYEKKLVPLKETRPNLSASILVPYPNQAPYILCQPINPLNILGNPVSLCGYKSDVNFSEEMLVIFRQFESERSKRVSEIKESIPKLYEKAIKSLGIQSYSYRDWSMVSELLPYLWWPAYPIYHVLKNYKKGLNRRDFYYFLAPLFFVLEVGRAIIQPKKAYQINNLYKLYVKSADSAAGLYLEPRWATSGRFSEAYLQFSDGTILNRDGIVFFENPDLNHQFYEPNFYIRPDISIKKDIDFYLSLKQKLLYDSIDFEESVTPQEHLELLRYCDFI